jgi:hypothetical protein
LTTTTEARVRIGIRAGPSPREGQIDRCVVGSHDDCAQSDLCENEGRCRAERRGAAMPCVE